MNKFKTTLKSKSDKFTKEIYLCTKDFPKSELYGITSQLRRASLSVTLNLIEGYARFRPMVYKNFLEISYGSLQESIYLIELAEYLEYIDFDDAKKLKDRSSELGKMLYHILRTERDFS